MGAAAVRNAWTRLVPADHEFVCAVTDLTTASFVSAQIAVDMYQVHVDLDLLRRQKMSVLLVTGEHNLSKAHAFRELFKNHPEAPFRVSMLTSAASASTISGVPEPLIVENLARLRAAIID